MLTEQHPKRAAKFRCHTADDHAEFRCLPIAQNAANELKSPDFSIFEGRFSAAATGFSPAGRGILRQGVGHPAGTLPLANLAALTLAGRVHKLPANLQGRAP